jgi:predicted nucleic acid-binding protein
MMIIDANLLIYAVNSDLPHHALARGLYRTAMGRDAGVPSHLHERARLRATVEH